MPTILKTKNSVTTTVAPTTLQQGELAVNITDKKMWVGNAATTPVQILGAGVTNDAGGSNTQVQFNSSGVLAGSANMTFNGTTLTVNDLTDSSLTANRVVYAGTGGNLVNSANFTFNGTTVTMANDASISGLTVGKGTGSAAGTTVVGNGAVAATNTGDNLTAVGAVALAANTSGTQNSAFGRQALQQNTTGSYNTALGHTASYGNTTGSNNVAVGRDSLFSNTTASFNTAVGYQALYSNTTGTRNTALGYFAGQSITTGTQCTFIGDYAGQTTTGTYNTFIGRAAGYLVTTGTNNTILGGYNGNQDGFDIRTASNYVVLSGGDGQRVLTAARGSSVALNDATPQFGTGITFPATQSASSDANTLDDYEEGTWTPTLTGWSSITYNTRNGTYVKIGRQVTCWFDIRVTAGTSSTAAVIVTGLPFTVGQSTNNGGGMTTYADLPVDNLTYYPAYPAFTATTINFYNFATGSTTTSNGNISGTKYLQGCVIYEV